MSWKVTINGKEYVVPDGQAFTYRENQTLPNGGYRDIETVYHPDGTRSTRSQDTSLEQMWISEGQALPSTPAPCPDRSTVIADWQKQWKRSWDRYIEKDKPEETSKVNPFRTGTRVFVRGASGKGDTLAGTVIDASSEMKLASSCVVVCTDTPGHQDWIESKGDLELWTGRGHALVATKQDLDPFYDQTRTAAFEAIPHHIGIVVAKAFIYDDVNFPSKCTGRILQQEEGGRCARVEWLTGIKNTRFYPTETESGKKYKRTYNVGIKYLKWCLLNNANKFLRVWPGQGKTTQPLFETGTIVVYTGNGPMSVCDNRRNYSLVRGVILKITGLDDQRCCYAVQVLGGCIKDAWGLPGRIKKNAAVKFESLYIEQGTKVEISANLSFKRNDLQGHQGVVILGTDTDGDIGVQFTEDLGAGSLDGQGKARHCLYVPASAVKTISK